MEKMFSVGTYTLFFIFFSLLSHIFYFNPHLPLGGDPLRNIHPDLWSNDNKLKHFVIIFPFLCYPPPK